MASKLKLSALALALLAGAALAHAQTPAQTPDTAPAQVMKPAQAVAVKKGLTFGWYPHDVITGTATVSCQGGPASPNPNQGACDPYNGDTPGNVKLPVLCFHKLGMPYPVPNTGASSGASHWSGGVIATTLPVSPIAMGWLNQPRAQVDAYCAAQFGPGWQVAEFHMGQGSGWKFGAYGHVGKPGKQRFWVHINNQANGNVWSMN